MIPATRFPDAPKNGSIVQSYQYSAFGNVAGGLTDKLNGSRYVGMADVDSDDDSGLQYMCNRWYDPQMGRFISRDPLGFGGGDLNLYRYVQNNPINLIDPTGTWSLSSVWDAVTK
jgi:RHS repeat-associated protein